MRKYTDIVPPLKKPRPVRLSFSNTETCRRLTDQREVKHSEAIGGTAPSLYHKREIASLCLCGTARAPYHSQDNRVEGTLPLHTHKQEIIFSKFLMLGHGAIILLSETKVLGSPHAYSSSVAGLIFFVSNTATLCQYIYYWKQTHI